MLFSHPLFRTEKQVGGYLVIIEGWFSIFLHKIICCGYSLETLQRGDSVEYPQLLFLWRTEENHSFITTIFVNLLNVQSFSLSSFVLKVQCHSLKWLKAHSLANDHDWWILILTPTAKQNNRQRKPALLTVIVMISRCQLAWQVCLVILWSREQTYRTEGKFW